MQQIVKNPQSKIVEEGYQYPKHRAKIIEELLNEQRGFCAYSEESLTAPTIAEDVEHFNPYLKGTLQDGYDNWFAVSHEINKRKGSKPRWDEHQPLADLTDVTLNSRILYDTNTGIYYAENPQDDEVKNLLKYLLVNDLGLPFYRKRYIESLKYRYTKEGLEDYLRAFPDMVRFPRAIEFEFGIRL